MLHIMKEWGCWFLAMWPVRGLLRGSFPFSRQLLREYYLQGFCSCRKATATLQSRKETEVYSFGLLLFLLALSNLHQTIAKAMHHARSSLYVLLK